MKGTKAMPDSAAGDRELLVGGVELARRLAAQQRALLRGLTGAALLRDLGERQHALRRPTEQPQGRRPRLPRKRGAGG